MAEEVFDGYVVIKYLSATLCRKGWGAGEVTPSHPHR
jgi:hypothetical protein